MNEARKQTEAFLLTYIKKITGSDFTSNLYKTKVFDIMSDEEFDTFMNDLADRKITLSVIVPTDNENKITVENNMKIGKELGYEFFQNLTVTGNDNLPAYTNPVKSFVSIMPIRRAAQLLTKKIAVSKSFTTIDTLTGQVTGPSKSSKLTGPEIHILIGNGFEDAIVELMKTRGGDEGESRALIDSLFNTGQASQAELREKATGVVSSKTLESYFQAMHIKANVLKR